MRTQLSRLLAFSVAGVTTLAAFSPDAFADRRSSLAGNMLIHDQDEVQVRPLVRWRVGARPRPDDGHGVDVRLPLGPGEDLLQAPFQGLARHR